MVQSVKNGLIVAFSIGLLFVLLSCSVSNRLAGSAGVNEIKQTEIPIEKITQTASVMPSNTAYPSATPTFTETPTPSPSPTATLHPMSIQALREMNFPGSEITLENELEPGANYRRYYASYRSEGLKIYGLLTIPNGEMPPEGWPAIIFNHGYIPPDVYRTTERYIAYVDWLARSQYIIFRIDYRGHDQSEGQPSGAYGDPGYVIDVLNAVSSIKQFPLANPEKIGMWGHSMGGYLTLRAMVTNSDVKAGVIWAGVVASYPDMINLWRRNNANPAPTAPSFARRWRQIWVEQYGTPEENPEFWKSVSSNSFLSEISGPLQLHHGTLDEEVPLIFSEILAQDLVNANKTVEFYKYEGDNHNLSNYFSTAMTRTVEFFDRYLK